MDFEDQKSILTAIHMLRCNAMAIRYGIIKDKNAMVVEAVNDMEKTIAKLEKYLFDKNEKTN